MSAPVLPVTPDQMLARASAGLGKVDTYGRRGVTMLSLDEIEAMALLLATFGLVPSLPGQPAPATFFRPPQET